MTNTKTSSNWNSVAVARPVRFIKPKKVAKKTSALDSTNLVPPLAQIPLDNSRITDPNELTFPEQMRFAILLAKHTAHIKAQPKVVEAQNEYVRLKLAFFTGEATEEELEKAEGRLDCLLLDTVTMFNCTVYSCQEAIKLYLVQKKEGGRKYAVIEIGDEASWNKDQPFMRTPLDKFTPEQQEYFAARAKQSRHFYHFDCAEYVASHKPPRNLNDFEINLLYKTVD